MTRPPLAPAVQHARMLSFLLDTSGFPPRWRCGPAWAEDPWLGWTHIVADLATFAAYVAIPVALLIVLRRSRYLPAPRLVSLFAVFILACGTVHLLEAVIFWSPVYRLSAVAKVVTAGASIMTAVVAAQSLPKLLEFRSPEELRQEVQRRVDELNQSSERLNLATKQLAEEKERLALALSAGAMGTWDWDLESGAIVFDEAEARLTEIPGEPNPANGGAIVQIDDFYRAVHREDLAGLQESVRRAIEDGAAFVHEFRLAHARSEWKWISGRGRVIREEGEPKRFIGVNYDITNQKRIEQELADARLDAEAASAAKSRFLANMSHEVRTPLTAILGCAESLTRDARDEDTSSTAEVIRRQGKLLLRVLNDVLDLSKIEAGKLTVKRGPCRLADLLEDVQSLMRPQAEEKGLAFEVTLDSATPEWVKTDSVRLRQVLLNLLSNCVKFTPDGSVGLRVHADAAGGDRTLRYEVTDTGPGVAEAERARIFEAFHQAQSAAEPEDPGHSRNQGTGLGLTISSRLARMLGGRIELSSEEGVGSTFTLVLPLVEAQPPTEAQAPSGPADKQPVPQDDAPRGRVLVAEDTPSIQFLLRRMLTPYATRLEIVDNGDAACRAADEAAAAGEPFDVVVLDMHMPVLSGYEAAPRLRDAGFTGPIIALTASAMVGDRERCLAAGCTAYVPKPIDWDTLEAEVRGAFTSGA